MKRYDFLVDKYVSGGILDMETLTRIIMSDPTTIPSTPPKVGKYVAWLLRCYSRSRNKVAFLDHLTQTKLDLKKFAAVGCIASKGDINQIRSVQELYKKVKNIAELDILPKKLKREEVLKRYSRKVYDDGHYDIYIPFNVEAARELGGPPLTNWCTNEETYFKRYNKQGHLFIIRDKTIPVKWGNLTVPQPICQFQFESMSCYDERDDHFDWFELLNNNRGLKDFFYPMLKVNIFKHLIHHAPRDYEKFFELYGVTSQDKKTIERQVRIWGSKVYDHSQINASEWYVAMKVLGLHKTLDLMFHSFSKDRKHLSIDLSDLPFEQIGNLPESINRFNNLESLKLSGCLEIFPNISHLKKLSVLSLTNNKLKSISKDIYKLKRLQILDIRRNEITEKIEPTTFLIIQ